MNAKLILALILMVGGVAAFNITTASYSVDRIHLGTTGGNLTSTSYYARSTTTYEQPSNINGTTSHYAFNVGWYDVNFTVTIVNVTVNTTIIYPPDGGAYGPAQCSQLVIVSTISTAPAGTPRLTECRLYNWDGWANTTYTLNQTQTSSNENATFNFTIPVSSPPNWIANCTETVGSVSAYTQNVSFTNVGNGPAFCNTDGTASTTEPLEYPIVTLIMLAITFIYFGGMWETAHIFLAPIGNFMLMLGAMSVATSILAIYLVAGGAYETAFTICVYALWVIGFYLMLRLLAMTWIVLKAVVWS